MRRKLNEEISKMISAAIENHNQWYTRPMADRLDRLEGGIACGAGHHLAPKILNDLTICPRCSTVLGKIVDPNAECKSPSKKN